MGLHLAIWGLFWLLSEVLIVPFMLQSTDNDLTKTFTPGDTPVANQMAQLLKPDGSVYAEVPIDANGNILYKPPVGSPNLNLTVVLKSNPTKSLGNFITDPLGNARFDIPIPPPVPVISGQVWFDNNLNGKPGDPTDTPLANTPIVLKFPNGSIYTTLTTGSDGKFNYLPPVGSPNTVFTIAKASTPNVPLGTLTTDPTGSGQKNIPLPPVVQPTIAVKVWLGGCCFGALSG